MPTSYWKYCYPDAGGEEICIEIFAKIPDDVLEDELRGEVAALSDLEALASKTPDATLRVRLVEALDDAAMRFNTRFSGRAVLRRADRLTFDDDDFGFVGVPGVVGMTHTEGFDTLRAAGYRVRTVWEWTSGSDEDMISGQEPEGGASALPPTEVAIFVRTLPPEPFEPDRPDSPLPE